MLSFAVSIKASSSLQSASSNYWVTLFYKKDGLALFAH